MHKFIITMLLSILPIMGLSTTKNSHWREIQTVLIPQTVEIHEGVTKSGNNKFWIEVEGIKVSISESNVSKFQKGEVKLELVKWYNQETNSYKYSTRQVKGTSKKKETKDIDLTEVFK